MALENELDNRTMLQKFNDHFDNSPLLPIINDLNMKGLTASVRLGGG